MTLNVSARPRAAAGRGAGRHPWAPLAVTLTGTFMIVLDVKRCS